MIKLQSIYNVNAAKVFQNHVMMPIFILGYISSFILLVLGVLFAFTSRNIYPVYLLLAATLPFALHLYSKLTLFQLIKRNNNFKHDIIQVFTFDEEGFKLEQNDSFTTFIDNYLYKEVYSIIKYKEYYFIYINRIQAFVIESRDYLLGSEEELEQLFKKVKDNGFIVKRKRKKKGK